MSFIKISHSKSDPGGQNTKASRGRPKFNTFNTADRLRESSALPMPSNIPKGRKSVFKEEGLGVSEHSVQKRRATIGPEGLDEKRLEEIARTGGSESEELLITTTTKRRHSEGPAEDTTPKAGGGAGVKRWLSKKLTQGEKRPKIKPAASALPPSSVASLSRVSAIALLIAVVLPSSSYHNGRQTVALSGADAALIRTPPENAHHYWSRQDNSPTDVCGRWAGQSAILNGTMYIYGGRSKTSESQTTDTWNNDLLALDLTKSWDTSSPALTGLPQPDGPPAVSLGYLWNDYHRLFLYGGQFSDSPPVDPVPMSMWMYDVASSEWSEFDDPRTSGGNYSAPEGQPIQRAAEGAGVSVPELGVSWYFGGHLDMYTTPGWSDQVERVYLRSLLEFTHPGYANSGVDSLQNSGAPAGGAYRNITEGGIQNEQGFTERADGVLVYVPGWGPNGILLGLGGGSVGEHETTDEFASMTTIDVYDIKTSEWYHQETRGEAPQVRVNPCAVVFSAPDASSFNIYMYGGQNLLPYGEQKQYTDIWILTVPSFTWVKVDAASDEPAARAGHQCAARDGQMVVVGGYTGQDAPCERTGVYAFDASGLTWGDRFNAAAAADHPPEADAGNSVLAGSYGYRVPEPVQSVVGGNAEGGATVTTPAAGPVESGPFATGEPPVFTVTAAASTATVTNGDGGPAEERSPAGIIAAAVIAGCAGLAALYLGFCAWLYRRQVHAYKQHMAVVNRYSNNNNYYDGGSDPEKTATNDNGAGSSDEKSLIAGAARAGVLREKLRKPPYCHGANRGSTDGSGGSGAGGAAALSPTTTEQFGWVGQRPLGDPPWMSPLQTSSEDASPGSGVGAAARGGSSGAGSSLPRPSEDRSPWGYPSYEGGYNSPGGAGATGIGRNRSDASGSSADDSVVEGLLDGRQPSFFSVVLGPRRALRVVNGMENEGGGERD